jgi:hypothetical protein
MIRHIVYSGKGCKVIDPDLQQETQEIKDIEHEGKAEEMKEEQGEGLLEDTDYEAKEVTPPEVSNATIALKKFDRSDLQKPNTKANQVRKVANADFAVVKTPGNGNWVKYSKKCLEKLGYQSIDEGTIDLAFGPFGIVSAKDLSGSGQTYSFSKGGHIYSKGLVEEITNLFKLDFTGVTTRSFNGPEYQVLDNGCTVAIINM